MHEMNSPLRILLSLESRVCALSIIGMAWRVYERCLTFYVLEEEDIKKRRIDWSRARGDVNVIDGGIEEKETHILKVM